MPDVRRALALQVVAAPVSRYCRPELAAYRDGDADLDLATLLEVLQRLELGRCSSCALRLHRCFGGPCTCPRPRCNTRRS